VASRHLWLTILPTVRKRAQNVESTMLLRNAYALLRTTKTSINISPARGSCSPVLGCSSCARSIDSVQLAVSVTAHAPTTSIATSRAKSTTGRTVKCAILQYRLCSGAYSDGGGVYRYIYPPNQSTLNVFMRLFCLLDPFIPTQIKFLATPLAVL